MKVLVTGGSGFIGSAVIRHVIRDTKDQVVNVDKLTYAATPEALSGVETDGRYAFEKVDICDRPALRRVLAEHRPDAVMHLAAESHVDRSIDSPAAFIETNVTGTYTLLEAATEYWNGLESEAQGNFRFHHVSTDEVYGSLGATGLFTEETPYRPNSPYSASKAGSDHLVRAWHHTFGLPVVASNCSNNYGLFQFPEKLIPLMVINGFLDHPLPVYGKGENVRDWLYVEDHARALWTILSRGRIGESYNVGGNNEMRNIDVVGMICDLLDELKPRPDGSRRRALITYVDDRPGHDLRYAIDASKIERELDWRPEETFATGLGKTVRWYLENEDWWRRIGRANYAGARLGLEREPRAARPLAPNGQSSRAGPKLLVFGANGQIGHALCLAQGRGAAITGLTRGEVDVTCREAVLSRVAENGCDLVVNLAAYTAVDKAESEPEAAFAVNRDGAGYLAEACARAGVPLLHVSTDYVFDGTKKSAYGETDPVHPLGVYGASKEAGEGAVRERLDRHVILRTSWVYGAWGGNFVKTMLRLGEERNEIPVVEDQFGCPTAAADLADAILEIASRLNGEPWGTYHYSGAGLTTWYDFANEIFSLRARLTGRRRPLLRPIATADYSTSARRPLNSELDCTRLLQTFGIAPREWRASLAGVLEELLRG